MNINSLVETNCLVAVSGIFIAVTDATLITIVSSVLAAIVPTIAAIAALKQSQKNAMTAVESDKKVAEQTVKIAEIHTATDGNLSTMRTELGVANEEIKGLKLLVATLTAPPSVSNSK